jgi:alpha-tubulin suppressor-like RCC1 family protein
MKRKCETLGGFVRSMLPAWVVAARVALRTSRLRLLAAVGASCVMAACGGGSSPTSDSLDLQGTASAEAALAGAPVSVRCASGPAQGITTGDGSFALSIRSGALPCMIQVSSGGRVYRSILLGSGRGSFRVNASPLTELVVARIAGALGSTPTSLFDAFGGNAQMVTQASLDSAISYLRTVFALWINLTGVNPLSDLLVAASPTTSPNALGSNISSFVAQIAAANTTLDALVAAVQAPQADSALLVPKISLAPVSVSVQAPDAARFSVRADSVLTPLYQWQMSSDGGTTYSDLPGATNAVYTITATQTTDSGRLFRARVYNAGGSAVSSAASLSVTAPAPTGPLITSQPQHASAPYGQAATFSVTASSPQAMSYQWSRDGAPITGATDPSYVIPMTVPGDDGANFTVVVTNGVGSTLSVPARLTVTDIPSAAPSRIAAGSSHSVAVRSGGTVWSWGNIKADIGTSLGGLMGVGNDPVVPGTPTAAKLASGALFTGAKAVAAGQWSTLVLKTDGTVWGWGYCGWGNLGNSTTFSFEQKSPVQTRLSDGTPLTSVVQLAAGTYSTSMAVTADGSVWGWGQNRYGHLGIGSSSETGQYSPVPMLSASGSGRFTGAIQVAPGISSTAVLKQDGTVFTVGWAGPLGDGSTVNRTLPGRVEIAPGVPLVNVVSIAAGANFYVAVTKQGTAYAWGANNKGQLGDGTTTSRGRAVLVLDANGQPSRGIVAAAGGADFTMFLKSDGTVWATGNNDVGQLGASSTTASLANPTLVRDASGAAFGDVVGVSALDSHTVVMRKDGTVWAWGKNSYLQLGDLTTVDRPNPIKVHLPAP